MSKTFNEILTPHETPPPHSFLKRLVRIIYDTIRGFSEDECYAKASALTFYSLLSVVPVLAVLFGIAKGFGFEQALESEIIERFSEQKEIADKLIQFAYSWLQNVKGGVIAGIGTIALFWSVLGLLNNVENALNSIWKTRISRPITRKISDYLATMVICPIFLVASSSITLFLSTRLDETAHSYYLVEALSPFLRFILNLFPFFLSWFLFTFVYLFMPNTQVYMRSALTGGIIAGTAFQIWQWLYIKFQLFATSYGAIYGSFAALPLFLIWLQVSWLILLAGAELAFEAENDLFIPSRKGVSISNKALAFLITYRCIESFAKGKEPQTDRSLAHEVGISLNHLHVILEILQKERIISAVASPNRIIGYQPARRVDDITFSLVSEAMDKSNELVASIQDSPQLNKIQEYLKKTDEEIKESTMNQSLYAALSEA